MARIGKCKKCGGELCLSVICLRNDYGVPQPTAVCKECFEEYPVEMKGASRNYTLIKEKR